MPRIGVIICVLLAGCASTNPFVGTPPIPALADPAARQLAAVEPLPNPAEIFTITEDIRRFISLNVAKNDVKRRKLMSLERAVHHPGSLGIGYDPTATLSVADTFRLQRGNCLSLSMLFVVMAREVGIDARFQEVKIDPYWDHRDGVVYSARHINVIGTFGRSSYVLDFYRGRPGEKLRPMKVLSDSEAIAQFYNNIGAEAVATGELAKGYVYLRRAITTAPTLGYLWSNLGVLLHKNGQLAEAETLLRYAISADATNTSAFNNLTRLLVEAGRMSEADDMVARLDRMQRANPYYHFARAERHIENRDFEKALQVLDKAIRLKPEEKVFYQLAQSAAQQTDDRTRAQKYEKAAKRLGL